MSTANWKIGVLYNPLSGRGRAGALAQGLIGPLERAGWKPTLQPVIDLQSDQEREAFFNGVDCAVIAGGDGTVRSLLETAARTGRPIWNYPAGNECLFARHFGMKADPKQLVEALTSGRTEKHHYGRANGVPFFLMASAGLDAAVIHRLHRDRKGGVSSLSYVVPTLREMAGYRSPALTVFVDGKQVLSGESGLFIAANSKEYAWKLDPVSDADSTAGELRCRFYPNDGARFYLGRLFAGLLGRTDAVAGEKRFAGREIVVSAATGAGAGGSVWAQADGDPAGELPLKIEVAPEMITVLRP